MVHKKSHKVMNKIYLVASMLLLAGCGPQEAPKEPAVRVLDVNSRAVFDDVHIKGAEHYDVRSLENAAKNWHKDTSMIVYCSDYMCMTSHIAAKKLLGLGFHDVVVYAGGIHEWYTLSKNDPETYPIEGAASMSFLQQEVQIKNDLKEDVAIVTSETVAQQLKKI